MEKGRNLNHGPSLLSIIHFISELVRATSTAVNFQSCFCFFQGSLLQLSSPHFFLTILLSTSHLCKSSKRQIRWLLVCKGLKVFLQEMGKKCCFFSNESRSAMKTSLWGLAKSSHPRPWKRAPSKVTAPRKRNHLAACLIFTYEICRQTAFHIILRCSKPMEGLMTAVNYKMADLSRGAKKKKKGREGGGMARMAKTHFGFLSIAPTSAPAPHGIKQGGGFERVNHFLQVVNSRSRPNESDVCVHIKWRHRSNTSPKRPSAPLSHSSWKLNNAGLWSPDKADLLHSLWLLLLTELNQTINFADVHPFGTNILSVMQF